MNAPTETADRLKGASETLLIPLACRARASREKIVPGFTDRKAEEICDYLDVDFDRYASNLPTLRGAVHRGLWFDSRVLAFLKKHPNAVILSIGSGLNTMYERVISQTGPLADWRWIDSDLADVIALRRTVFDDAPNRITVEIDASSTAWLRCEALTGPAPLLVISEAVLIYLPEAQVADVFKGVAETGVNRSACGFLFDWCSPEMVKRSRSHPAIKKLKDQSVVFQSSMRRAKDIHAYHPDWRIVAEASTPMTRSGIAPALFYFLFKLTTGRRPYGLAEASLNSTRKKKR